MAAKLLLGELLIQQNLVTQETLNEALRVQITGYRRLGGILVRMGALSGDQLAEVLARQLEIEITDVRNNFTPEVRKKLPRHLCRKYDAIPLRLKSNNILEVAMSDPSDHQAISDLEQFTGNIVEPRLARHTDIASATTKCIPFSLSDVFSPLTSTRLAVALCLILVAAVGTFSYQYISSTKYGEITRPTQSNPATTYSNLDLIVNHTTNGKILLSGRGAFSKGLYNVAFNDLDELRSFLEKRKSDFSRNQLDWLNWVVGKVGSGTSQAVASKH